MILSDSAKILDELRLLYPSAKPELVFSNPYEILVATILSAQCTDKQVNKVTPAVFSAFPSVTEMASCSPEALYPYVKSCGFKTKAFNIVMACRLIVEKYCGLVPDTMHDLLKLPGVGRKTANVILANAFGIPAIAVDTHVFRVSNRLGLANATTVEQTERQLQDVIPRQDWSAAHHWIIFHGRRVCHARKPECDDCTLRHLCKKIREEAEYASIKPA
jgi:endonuclease III